MSNLRDTNIRQVSRHLGILSASASPSRPMRAQELFLFVCSNLYLFAATFIYLQQILFYIHDITQKPV
jgi:hypothetical protein